MKAREMTDTFGWYNHFVLLAGGDYLKLGQVVGMERPVLATWLQKHDIYTFWLVGKSELVEKC